MTGLSLDLAATIDSFGDYLGLLPDPDLILKKLGCDTSVYSAIRCDPDVESCIEDRQSATLLKRWEWVPGGDTKRARALRDLVAEHLTPDFMYPHIESMLDAPFYGLIPVEIMWTQRDGHTLIDALRTLPTNAVGFDDERRPVLKEKYFQRTIPVPDGKMILVRKNYDWKNPYGRKLFSALFWPVTFRRGGLKYWYEFMDRYGLPHISAELPEDIYEKKRDEVSADLASTVRNAVTVYKKGMNITHADVRVSGTSDMYDRFQESIGATIARVIAGATLARDTGRHGGFAQAREHGRTQDRRAVMDQGMVEVAGNEIAAFVAKFNDPDTPAPLMRYRQPADLHAEQAKRDKIVHSMGWAFSLDYMTRTYGYRDGDITAAPERGRSDFSAHTDQQQRELDDFITEQILSGGHIADAQAHRIVKALKGERTASEIEAILSDIAGEDDEEYARLMSDVLVAADMYGRESLRDEVGT